MYCISIYIFSILIAIISMRQSFLQWGKDHGLLAQIISTCIADGFLFFLLKKNIQSYLLGFLTGIIGYLITNLIYLLLSFLIYEDNRGFDISSIYDQLITSSFVVFVAFFYWRRCSR